MVDMEVVNNCQSDLELIINRWILDFYYSRGIEFFRNDKKEDFLSVKNVFESKHESDGLQNFLLLVRAFAGIFVLILFELVSFIYCAQFLVVFPLSIYCCFLFVLTFISFINRYCETDINFTFVTINTTGDDYSEIILFVFSLLSETT